MKSHLFSDPLDFNADPGFGDGVIDFGSLLSGPASSGPGASSNALSASTPVAPVLPDESVQAMAANESSGSGGPGSVVAETSSSGFNVNLIFDAAAMAAPASFRTGIEQAAAILSATITNKITVNIDIDYKGTGGSAAAGPSTGLYESYSSVRADLIANEAPGDTTFNALPNTSTIQGQSQVAVWNTQLKLFGLLSPTNSAVDGAATFSTDINPNLLVGVALHELTHAMGRVPYGPSTAQPTITQPDIFDFYRFTSTGNILIDGNSTAPPAYFSLDGGVTKIADFGQTSDASDFLNSGVQGANDPFNEFYSSSTLQSLTSVDLKMLDALGFNVDPLGIVVVGNTVEALQGGSKVSLLTSAPSINDSGSTTLSGATIKIANTSGNAVAGDELAINGQQSGTVDGGLVTVSWNATTDTLTLSGSASIATYETLLSEITFQDTGTDTSSGSHPVRTVTWTINDGTNSYNATSTIDIDRAPIATNSTATDVVGTTLSTTASNGVLSNASDLDSDSLTVTAVSDTAHGAGTIGASLAGSYGHLTLNANGSYSYVADNTTALAGAPTGSHLQDVFSYTLGDGLGGTTSALLTVTLDRAPVVTAANATLDSADAVAASSLFSATDPDGNAITTYAFENTGSGHFVLNGVVEPSNQEIDVSAAQLSQLTYQSAIGSVDTLEVRANDGTLWSDWQSFTITPTDVIEAHGSTSLVEVGNNYYLDPIAGGTGPELKYDGAAVVPGQFGVWTLIGAEATSAGYEVAWRDAADNLYTVWDTDNSGNFLNNPIGSVSPTSAALEALETSFHQDLNGDGVIGINLPTTVIESLGSTSLVEVGNNYYLNPVGGGTGPELMYNGSPVVAGQFSSWTLIGAEATSTGYEVAWKDAADDLYTVWNTDSSGNFLNNPIGSVSPTSTALEALETSFHQDLNGDGVIGVNLPTTVIESLGSTSLVEVGNNYYLNPVGGGTGPELKYNGAAVAAGQFGVWTPIGAEATATGYEVAWKDAADNLYTVWNTDNSGNFVNNPIGSVSPTSTALEALEPSFHQDLNGDGVIGVPPTSQAAGDEFTTSNLVSAANFSPDNFHFSSSGDGVTGQAPASSASQGSATAMAWHDFFVFASNHGPAGTAGTAPWVDAAPSSNSAVANIHAALTGAHEDAYGASNIPDAAHFCAHHSGFHLA